MDNLETIITKRTQELSTLMKERDAFLAVLTHDMKTPLTSINLYATLIKNHPETLLTKPHLVNNILRGQKSLTEMVDNILDLEKLQAGETMSMNLERLDLVPILEYTVEALRPLAEEKAIQMQADIGTAAIIIDADRQQIERVLQNLISNAIKYTPKEGQVLIEACLKNEAVTVNIRDSGYGIPEEELGHIFDRFRRVSKHKGKAVGTGLGLAITKALVEAHHGTITVTSQEDSGSTFSISLPVYIES